MVFRTMGVADRYYMRDEYHPPRVTTKLIIALVIAFIIQSVLLHYGQFDIGEELALSLGGLKSGKIWQLFTFQFLHSTPWPWHLLINCFVLYFFGRRVEETLGAKRFLGVYFLAGFVGGMLQMLLTLLLPKYPNAAVVGASAGISGIMAVFCSLFPMEELRTWIYFFPITVRAYYLLIFISLYSLYGTIVPFDHTAHAAHLGGLLVGIGYVRWRRALYYRFPKLASIFDDRPAPGGMAKSSRWRRERKASDQFISKEVDPILDKISSHGIDSLTDEERAILDSARKKMR
ncbi:MAG TPA: rhomboid family intramembrane serine protease [Candidatus Saccharimonadales bacterium]|nr:rhomboid family intramembrane serine protease [Candidatus Saccharimonadales bacterium]